MATKQNGSTKDGNNIVQGKANKGHNVKDLHKLIRSCAQDMIGIKKSRASLNEQAGDIRQRLKDSGVGTEQFQFAVRLLEKDAKDRATYIDQLELNFEALGVRAPVGDHGGGEDQPSA